MNFFESIVIGHILKDEPDKDELMKIASVVNEEVKKEEDK